MIELFFRMPGILAAIAAGFMLGFTFWNWYIGQHQRQQIKESQRQVDELMRLVVEQRRGMHDMMEAVDGNLGWVRHLGKEQAVSLDGSPPC